VSTTSTLTLTFTLTLLSRDTCGSADGSFRDFVSTQAIVTSRGHVGRWRHAVTCCGCSRRSSRSTARSTCSTFRSTTSAVRSSSSRVKRSKVKVTGSLYASSGRLHLVDVPRLQTERDVQRDRATDHLLHTQEPGRHVIHVDTEKLLKKLEELSIEVYITHAGHSIA